MELLNKRNPMKSNEIQIMRIFTKRKFIKNKITLNNHKSKHYENYKSKCY